jgi:hypothetical protein
MTVNGSGDDFPSTHVFGAIRGDLPARDGHTGELPIVHDATQAPYQDLAPETLDTAWEAAHPPPTGDSEHDDGKSLDVRAPEDSWEDFQHWQRIRILDMLATAVINGTEPAYAARRTACALVSPAAFIARIHENATFTEAGSRPPHRAVDGTPMRCSKCQGIYTLGTGEPDWVIAGREDTTCEPCTLAAPKHAAKPATATVKAKAPAPPGTRRTRPSRARKAAITRTDTP